MVVILSVFQSRFRIIKDSPVTFFLLLLLFPVLLFGKAAKIKTWTGLTGFEIWGWTLVLAYFNPKRIVPKVNEGYILTYTLFHWYLLIEAITLKGFNFLTVLVLLISIYPTLLILKSSVESKKLSYQNKLILYYWFLFTVSFTYADQVALKIITPIIAFNEINLYSSLYVIITAIQLYFIAMSLSLLFVGIPIFHLDRSFESFKVRWANAMADWREIVSHKLGNFVEYQINLFQFLIILVISAFLFFIDQSYNFRPYLIFIYTVAFPLAFFYLKWSPDENL